MSLSNEKWDRSEGVFCPFSAPRFRKWLRGRDLNPRPLGYEPNELPDCSTPRKFLKLNSKRQYIRRLIEASSLPPLFHLQSLPTRSDPGEA